jgi:hypothetical protein
MRAGKHCGMLYTALKQRTFLPGAISAMSGFADRHCSSASGQRSAKAQPEVSARAVFTSPLTEISFEPGTEANKSFV